MTAQPDLLGDALDELAAAAETSAAEQRGAARLARRLARRRRDGAAGDANGFADQLPTLLGSLTASAQRIAAAVLSTRRGWVQTLGAEGNSIRRIGSLLGVSHQRVSALLHGDHTYGKDRHA